MKFDEKILITADQIKRAEKLYPTRIFNNSITKGQRNLAATISEIVIADYCAGEWVADKSYDYDIIVNGSTIDIKMRQIAVDMKPQPYWNCGVFDINPDQKCDWYGWVTLRDNYKFLWLNGFLKPVDFYANCFHSKKGDRDPSKPSSPFRMPEDAYNIALKDLQKVYTETYK